MPLTVTTTRVFNREANPKELNHSERFIGADFLYILAPDIPEEMELDAFLQVFLLPSVQRKIQLESPSILARPNQINTETVTRIPSEFKGYEMEVVLLPSTNDFLEVWVSGSSSPCEVCEELGDQLDSIERKVELAVATNVIRTIVDVVLSGIFDGIISGVARELIGPSTRKFFKILNPIGSSSPIWVDILPTLPVPLSEINQQSFETIIPPGFEWQPSYGFPDSHIVGWSDGKLIEGVNIREYFE